MSTPRPLTLGQLRMLVLNSEMRVDHLTEWAHSIHPGDYTPPDFDQWIEAAHLKLVHHRARLAGAQLLAECRHQEPVLQNP